ncbi:MAG: hypothetical protein EA384_08825 [Spirochaetaceae bacterium]|nr:MAG: hypothetical protein EA384_08825 [Spirochaetaceae bacterium]
MPRTRSPVALLVPLIAVVMLITTACDGLLSPSANDAGRQNNDGTRILYDSSLGTLPGDQQFRYLRYPLFGAQATETYNTNVTVLDTSPDITELAGYFAGSPAAPTLPTLVRSRGYTVTFALQVDEEDHGNRSDRAGFSIIILSDDLLGISLGFWEDSIWAHEGGESSDLFARAEELDRDTTAELVTYRLTILGSRYALFADGQQILTGTVRDYTAFEGFSGFNPYRTPNFIFLGDNSQSAAARVRLGDITLSVPAADPVPDP